MYFSTGEPSILSPRSRIGRRRRSRASGGECSNSFIGDVSKSLTLPAGQPGSLRPPALFVTFILHFAFCICGEAAFPLSSFPTMRRLSILVASLFFFAATAAAAPRSWSAPSGCTTRPRSGSRSSALGVVGTALYVAAHPDDENTAMIAWLSNGRLVRTGYLAVTRGRRRPEPHRPREGGSARRHPHA